MIEAVVSSNDIKSGDNPTKLMVQQGLDAIYLRQLRRISQVMIAYYSFITISHYYFLVADIRLMMMGFSIVAMVASSAVFLLVRANKIPPAKSHGVFLPVALLGILGVYSHVFLSGEQIQLTNGILLLFAFSFATLSPAAFSFIFALCCGLYIAALLVVSGPQTTHFAFLFIAAAALTILCFVLRYRTLMNSERLLISNGLKATKLVEASKRIRENMDEVRASAAAADRANAAKDVFLANTTHELRTPLTGVLGMMDYLSETELDRDQRQAVDAAQFSAKTLLVVVNDLLDIAKLDAGKMELVSQAFSPSTIITHVVGLLRSKAESKSLSLKVLGVKSVTTSLKGDPVRIGQVVLNLLDNAIKFSADGEIVVMLQVEPKGPRQKKAALHISVQDNGPGISPEDQDRLFARFEQLDATANSHAAGAGLGLSICKELATRMGGSVSVQSSVGAGSTFSFDVVLPIADVIETRFIDAEVASADGPEAAVQENTPAVPGHTPPRILLAEDNIVNQLLVKKLAVKFGWTLTVAGNGEDAVRHVKDNGPFDLVFMDIRMPVMNGIEATKAIKALAADKADTPIIALTANTGEDVEAEYRAHGIAAIIGKPIDASALRAAVNQLLGGQET